MHSKRIAMWSGPRNISTALMRSWENRQDCSVIDEPFYAAYLARTQAPHPMFDEVLGSQSQDYAEVVEQLTSGPCHTPLQYQKHMTQHIAEDADLNWTRDLSHCFLIRDPAAVVVSYTASRGECSVLDVGIIRQYELYKEISAITGKRIPIVDSDRVLNDPKATLSTLCTKLGVAFDERMLSWPAGKRDTDGIWASHWYHSVEKSTVFLRGSKKEIDLSPEQKAIVKETMPFYQELKSRAI